MHHNNVIVNRRVNHGLREYVVQSDNGEFVSDNILSFLKSVGGERRTCCSYTPEIQAFIERLWGIIHNMASAMLIDKGLSEEYWQYAQEYSADIYNNIPPSRTPKGQEPRSPNEKFFGVNEDIKLYKIFGCRAFANIPKEKRRKNHNPRAVQCIFVGLDRTTYPGYKLYSPEFRTIYVSGNVKFFENHRYDGSLARYHAEDVVKKDAELPVEDVSKYMYLVGTSHIDPDNGLLYKVTKVEEKLYRGQGRYIVAYRAQVFPDGRVCIKGDKEPYHVHDIEKYLRIICRMFTITIKIPLIVF